MPKTTPLLNTVDVPALAKDNPASEAKFSLLNTDDVLALAKDNPASAAKLSLNVEQWVSLAQKDPQATGKLIYDQTRNKTDTHGKVIDKALFEIDSDRAKAIGEALCNQLKPTQFSKVISEAFKQEIQNEMVPASLLRGKSVGTKLYNEFETNHMRPILNPKIVPLLNSIPKEPLVKEDEKFNRFINNEDDLKNLTTQSREIFSEILLDDCEEMVAFREIVSNIRIDGDNKEWKNEENKPLLDSKGQELITQGTKVADTFALLRLLIPAITTPSDRGVKFEYENKEHKANGVVLGKILQNLANGTIPRDTHLTEFHKEKIAKFEGPEIKNLMNQVYAKAESDQARSF
ncbi:MAG: hypothetical protein H0W50_05810 [Parachlamydiaceae bacterium]|nr:hypothetical protein [Parachlamydiaceae bacterium]